MSPQISLFTPVERIALALHRHRWRNLCVGLASILVPFLLLLAAHENDYVPPHLLPLFVAILLTISGWAWCAFLLAVWFGPNRRLLLLSTSNLTGGSAFIWFVVRFYRLIIVMAFALGPVVMWLVLWRLR